MCNWLCEKHCLLIGCLCYIAVASNLIHCSFLSLIVYFSTIIPHVYLSEKTLKAKCQRFHLLLILIQKKVFYGILIFAVVLKWRMQNLLLKFWYIAKTPHDTEHTISEPIAQTLKQAFWATLDQGWIWDVQNCILHQYLFSSALVSFHLSLCLKWVFFSSFVWSL